jgi:hypothetical protein
MRIFHFACLCHTSAGSIASRGIVIFRLARAALRLLADSSSWSGGCVTSIRQQLVHQCVPDTRFFHCTR